MPKILLIVLAALAALLGLHVVFGLVLFATLAAATVVVLRGMETGWSVIPRAARA